jgi:hypothetical protein
MGWFKNIFQKKVSPQQDVPEQPLPKNLSAVEKGIIAVEVELAKSKIEFLEGNERLVKQHGLNSPITWKEVEKLQLEYKNDHERLTKKKDELYEKYPANQNYELYDKKRTEALEKLEERADKLEENVERNSWQISDNFKKFKGLV